jgi:hypothetical protein
MQAFGGDGRGNGSVGDSRATTDHYFGSIIVLGSEREEDHACGEGRAEGENSEQINKFEGSRERIFT